MKPTIVTYPMPKVEPVPLNTKSMSWWRRFIKALKRRQWRMVEDYTLYIRCLGRVGLVPKGFVFDFASVPRIFWPVISPTGVLLAGSVFHDFGYHYGGLLLGKIDPGGYSFIPSDRKTLDFIFADITRQVTGATVAATTAHGAVRIGGYLPWCRFI